MTGETYARAGVDVGRVRSIQRSLAEQLGATFALRRGRVGAPLIRIGHYGGLVDIGGGNALALHTDGVGTKVLVAQEMEKFDTVGVDCVAMTVNDLICLGAEPLALMDYIALEREDEWLVSELAKGLVDGARSASAPIVGGETAVMGEVVRGLKGRGFDLVSMGVGVVEKERVLDGSAIETGDAVVGVASSGLHSNGYTLARRILRGRALDERLAELGSSLGDALLAPTHIYVKPALEAIKRSEVHGIGHVTGGSFSKLARLVDGRKLMFELSLPPAPPLFSLLQREGGVSRVEMRRTFNMGIGLCVCVPEADAGRVMRTFKRHGFESHDLGSVKRGTGVRVDGLKLS